VPLEFKKLAQPVESKQASNPQARHHKQGLLPHAGMAERLVDVTVDGKSSRAEIGPRSRRLPRLKLVSIKLPRINAEAGQEIFLNVRFHTARHSRDPGGA